MGKLGNRAATALGAGWKAAALFAAVGAASGCSETASPEEGPATPARRGEALVAHEWGTFTSVLGSDGQPLEGLHHAEEPLPPFVYGRSLDAPERKSVEALPEGVTQKLETPVVYFHGAAGRDVRFEVDFPGGVISEWYPDSTAFAPEIGALEQVGGGRMRWDVRLLERADAMLDVPEDSVWAPSRDVEARAVAVGDEQERFIFYRGLGRFEVPLRLTHRDDGLLHLTNGSEQSVPAAFLLHIHEGGSAIRPLGSIGPGETVTVQPGPKESETGRYLERARSMLQESLTRSGLYADEARAMVDTWERSYFRTRGLRVLYVLPRQWTDELLPVRVTPQPTELVRTLVGRIEVMTRAREEALLEELEASMSSGGQFRVERLGRFAEPKLRRAQVLATDPSLASYIGTLVERATGPQ